MALPATGTRPLWQRTSGSPPRSTRCTTTTVTSSWRSTGRATWSTSRAVARIAIQRSSTRMVRWSLAAHSLLSWLITRAFTLSACAAPVPRPVLVTRWRSRREPWKPSFGRRCTDHAVFFAPASPTDLRSAQLWLARELQLRRPADDGRCWAHRYFFGP